jgi:hypothetical protein
VERGRRKGKENEARSVEGGRNALKLFVFADLWLQATRLYKWNFLHQKMFNATSPPWYTDPIWIFETKTDCPWISTTAT